MAIGILAVLALVMACNGLATASQSVAYSSTADFDNGTKLNVTTISDRYNITSGTMELDFPYAEKDDNLVSYWRFENGITDQTGANDGAAVTGRYSASGKFGGCYGFDGVNQHVQISNSTSMQPAEGDWSMSFWFKKSGAVAADQTFYAHGLNSATVIYLDSTAQVGVYSTDATNEESTETTTTYTDTAWHHVVAVYDIAPLNRWTIYVDGAEPGQTITVNDTVSNQTNDGDASFGYWLEAVDMPFYGFLDEPKIYNRTLNLTDVQELYNSGAQYLNSSTWDTVIVSKPLTETLAFLDIAITGGTDTAVERVTIVDVLTDAEITSYDNNITGDTRLSYSDFDRGLLVTSGKVVKVRLYLGGTGSDTVTVNSLTAMWEPWSMAGKWDVQYVTGVISIQRSANKVIATYTGPDTSIIRWDFGDGSGATGRTVGTTYAEPGNHTITVYAHYDDGTVLYSNVTIYFDHWMTIYDKQGDGYHITITNSTLYASGCILVIIGLMLPDMRPFFEWNTAKLRIGIGLVMIFAATLYTAGLV